MPGDFLRAFFYPKGGAVALNGPASAGGWRQPPLPGAAHFAGPVLAPAFGCGAMRVHASDDGCYQNGKKLNAGVGIHLRISGSFLPKSLLVAGPTPTESRIHLLRGPQASLECTVHGPVFPGRRFPGEKNGRGNRARQLFCALLDTGCREAVGAERKGIVGPWMEAPIRQPWCDFTGRCAQNC